MDNPSKDNQFNELKKEVQELRKENFQLKNKNGKSIRNDLELL